MASPSLTPKTVSQEPRAQKRVTSKCSKTLSLSPAMAWWHKNASAKLLRRCDDAPCGTITPPILSIPVSWCLPMCPFWDRKRWNTVNKPGWFWNVSIECRMVVENAAFSTCAFSAHSGPKVCTSRIPPLAYVAPKQPSTQQEVKPALSCQAAGNSAIPKPQKKNLAVLQAPTPASILTHASAKRMHPTACSFRGPRCRSCLSGQRDGLFGPFSIVTPDKNRKVRSYVEKQWYITVLYISIPSMLFYLLVHCYAVGCYQAQSVAGLS